LKGDTLVLLENGKKIWVRSKAVFRILKLLEGKYAWMGVFAYVPGVDLLYRAVVHHRRLFQ
jgi:predicted DCC family thiol-disulfide oxidoreductase YuxK